MAEVLTPEQKETIYVASGRAHPDLAQDVADEMGVTLGAISLGDHANGEMFTKIEENVQGKTVIIVQSHVASGGRGIQDAIFEHMLMAGAARQAGASSVMAVAPYFGYARSDKRDNDERVSIGAQVAIDGLVSSGVKSFAAFDLHAGQIEGMHRGRFLNLHMLDFLQAELRQGLEVDGHSEESWLVVSPDSGAVKSNERLADRLGVDQLVFIPKSRSATDSRQLTRWPLGFNPEGRACVMLDDIIDSAGTIVTAAAQLKDAGASAVHIAATHNVFSGKAVERLQGDEIDRIVVSDTHPASEAQAALGDKLTVAKCGPILGKALVRALTGGSVSALFR